MSVRSRREKATLKTVRPLRSRLRKAFFVTKRLSVIGEIQRGNLAQAEACALVHELVYEHSLGPVARLAAIHNIGPQVLESTESAILASGHSTIYYLDE